MTQVEVGRLNPPKRRSNEKVGPTKRPSVCPRSHPQPRLTRMAQQHTVEVRSRYSCPVPPVASRCSPPALPTRHPSNPAPRLLGTRILRSTAPRRLTHPFCSHRSAIRTRLRARAGPAEPSPPRTPSSSRPHPASRLFPTSSAQPSPPGRTSPQSDGGTLSASTRKTRTSKR